MSRRSPLNARYQKYTEPKGRTRKSAAAAKPAREGSKATSSSAKSSARSKSASRSRLPARGKSRAPQTPEYMGTPEYKLWRRWWWITLLAGMALVAVPLVIQYVFHSAGVLRVVEYVSLALAYAALIAAFVIDFRKLRPLRRGEPLPSARKKGTSDGTDDTVEREEAKEVVIRKKGTKQRSEAKASEETDEAESVEDDLRSSRV